MKADLLILNGHVHFLDDQLTTAEALACLNGRILAVGSSKELISLAGPNTEILDLNGRTVLPGFIDAHEHLSWFAEEPLKLDVSAKKVKSLADLIRLVQSEAGKLAPGEWIHGVLYDDTKMEGGLLTRNVLDGVAPKNPVIIIHVSGHWAVVNSAALAAGGLTEETPDPKGGELGREPGTGRLTGRLTEMAMFNFAFESLAVTPTIVPPFSRELRRMAVKKAAAILNAAGICGVGDALTGPSYITTYHDLHAAGELTVRVNMMIPYIFLPRLEKIGLLGPWGNEWIRASGIKVIIDGAIAGRTAALKDGYANAPGNHGVLLIQEQAELDEIIGNIHRSGYQACIHANGDIAIEMALKSIEKAQSETPRKDPRHRIEHCTMVDDRLLASMARLGVIALPFGSYIWQHGEKLRPFYGKRADRMFAHGSFLQAGVKVAGSSDHPAGLYPPMLGVQSMMTRQTPAGEVIGPGERIPLLEAFRMFTQYAAYATGEERTKGQLSPGMLADMVILDQNPWKCRPEEISAVGIHHTIVGGRVVFGGH